MLLDFLFRILQGPKGGGDSWKDISESLFPCSDPRRCETPGSKWGFIPCARLFGDLPCDGQSSRGVFGVSGILITWLSVLHLMKTH